MGCLVPSDLSRKILLRSSFLCLMKRLRFEEGRKKSLTFQNIGIRMADMFFFVFFLIWKNDFFAHQNISQIETERFSGNNFSIKLIIRKSEHSFLTNLTVH